MFRRTFSNSAEAARACRADMEAADRARKWGMKDSEQHWQTRSDEAFKASYALAKQEAEQRKREAKKEAERRAREAERRETKERWARERQERERAQMEEMRERAFKGLPW
jgi:uncharacterized damage-inducible protein DinB